MLPLFADNPHRRAPAFVALIVATNIAMMIFESTRPDIRTLTRFIEAWGLVPARLWNSADSKVWLTPLTSTFLHGGWLHLIGNCWFLWLFGTNVEDRQGSLRFLPFYIASGLGAAAFQVAIDPHSPVPMVGASGAISGVLAAYLRYFPTAPIYTLVPLWFAPILPVPAFIFIAAWFGLQFWQGMGSVSGTGIEAGVAWWAHIGGFVTGFFLAGAMSGKRRTRR